MKELNDNRHLYIIGGASSKESASNGGDLGLILGLGKSLEEGMTIHPSCLENPRDRGAWQATVHRVTENLTCLKQLSIHTHTHIYVCICVCVCAHLGKWSLHSQTCQLRTLLEALTKANKQNKIKQLV